MTITTLLFDLDDTLFLEADFVRSGHRAVAQAIAQHAGLDQDQVFNLLRYEFLKSGRTSLFNRTLAALGASQPEVSQLVKAYRTHSPKLELAPVVRALLERLSQQYQLAIVTDGAHGTQQRKVAALGLNQMITTLVYCDEIGFPKPSPQGFLEAARRLNASPQACIVIGDDPFHDTVCARAGGFACCRVRTGRYAELPTTDTGARFVEIGDLSELEAALRRATEWAG